MSSLAVASGDGELDSGPPPSTINSIVPGSIFQDDVPSTFAEGGYDPQQANPPPATVTNGSGFKNVEIEVNSTIQTILISLGIAVGAMFLLGVVAAQFISHKNKRAALKKKLDQGGEKGGREGGGGDEGDDGDEEEEIDVEGGQKKRGNNNVVEAEDHHDRITRFSEKHELTVESSMFDGGIGPNMSRRPSITGQLLGPDGPYSGATMYSNDNSPFHGPSSTTSSTSHPSFRLSNSASSYQNPKGGSIIGSVGIGAGGRPGGSNIHGSVGGSHANAKNSSQPMSHHQYQPHHPSDHNPRNMVVDGNIYEQRQGGDLHIGIPPSAQQNPYSHYSISPSSAGTPTGNPFASPPMSASSNASGMDPFRTQNNSQASLNLMQGSSDSMAKQEDQYASRNPFYGHHHTLGHDYFGHAASTESLGHQHASPERHVTLSSISAMGGHSPPIVIHGADQVHPMDMMHTSNGTHVTPSSSGHNLASSSTDTTQTLGPVGPLSGPLRTPPAFSTSSPGISPFQTPPRAVTRSSTTTGVLHQSPDRRSFAGALPSREAGTPVNEGNAWYRKRASVIIPEGNAHVRLWGDNAHQPTLSSSSSSSSLSSASFSSPPRNTKSALDPPSSSSSGDVREGRSMAKPIISSPTITTTHLSSVSSEPSEPSPNTVARNGAAVFEGTRSASRSPSHSRQDTSAAAAVCASPVAPTNTLTCGGSASEEGSERGEGAKLHVAGGSRATARHGSLLSDEAVEYPPVVARRRGSVAHQANIANRQSYWDDYNGRQK
ncbi:hypothetical protein BG005_005778 [Podila minutissima]|nr:hypothetical protein BG005_005778 [Podila minutissima]